MLPSPTRRAARPLVVRLVVREEREPRAVVGDEDDGAEPGRGRLDARRGVDETFERHFVAEAAQHDLGVRRILHAGAVGLEVVALVGRHDVAERTHGRRRIARVVSVGDERLRRRTPRRHRRHIGNRLRAACVGEPPVERRRPRQARGAAGDELKAALFVALAIVEGAEQPRPGDVVIPHAQPRPIRKPRRLDVPLRRTRRKHEREPHPATAHATCRSYHGLTPWRSVGVLLAFSLALALAYSLALALASHVERVDRVDANADANVQANANANENANRSNEPEKSTRLACRYRRYRDGKKGAQSGAAGSVSRASRSARPDRGDASDEPRAGTCRAEGVRRSRTTQHGVAGPSRETDPAAPPRPSARASSRRPSSPPARR